MVRDEVSLLFVEYTARTIVVLSNEGPEFHTYKQDIINGNPECYI